jgi:hypothetical protein
MPITINGSTGIAGIDGSAGTPALQGSDTNTGIAFGTDVILASTGGTERWRVDSSGRLLVGTSTARINYSSITPQFQYEYGTNNNARGFAITYNDTSTTGPVVFLGKTKGATVGSNTLVASGDELGQITFNGSDGTNMLQGAAIVAAVDGTPGTNDMPGRLVFSTTADGASTPTERMRIGNNGQVYIGGTTNPSGFPRTSLICTATSSSHYGVHVNATSAVSTSLLQFSAVNTDVGAIVTNGTSSVSYNTTSDYRLKENVVPLSDAADRVKLLKPSRFNFIADPGKTVDGFIAHEAQAVVPECVTGEKDAVDDDGNPIYQGIDQSKLVPLLTAALQEAIAKIETLEASNADLLSRVAALEVTP